MHIIFTTVNNVSICKYIYHMDKYLNYQIYLYSKTCIAIGNYVSINLLHNRLIVYRKSGTGVLASAKGRNLMPPIDLPPGIMSSSVWWNYEKQHSSWHIHEALPTCRDNCRALSPCTCGLACPPGMMNGRWRVHSGGLTTCVVMHPTVSCPSPRSSLCVWPQRISDQWGVCHTLWLVIICKTLILNTSCTIPWMRTVKFLPWNAFTTHRPVWHF